MVSQCTDAMELFLRQRGGIVKNIFKRKPSDFPTEYTVTNAFKKGDMFTKLSFIFLGIGNILRKQVTKGILFMATEIAYIYYMISFGLFSLSELPTIGSYENKEVWNENDGIFEYIISGTRSVEALLYAVLTIIITLLFVAFWREAVKSAYKAQCLTKEGKHVNSFKDDVKDLFNVNLHKLLLTLPLAGILTFTILPLVFMILQAFTNYSYIDEKLIRFDWTGLDAFKKVLSLEGTIGKQFWSVLGWTIVWIITDDVINEVTDVMVDSIIEDKEVDLTNVKDSCMDVVTEVSEQAVDDILDELKGSTSVIDAEALKNNSVIQQYQNDFNIDVTTPILEQMENVYGSKSVELKDIDIEEVKSEAKEALKEEVIPNIEKDVDKLINETSVEVNKQIVTIKKETNIKGITKVIDWALSAVTKAIIVGIFVCR